MEAPVVNKPQWRHYAVLLAMLEETLREIERIAEGAVPPGRLSALEADLPRETADLLLRECADVRERVYRLADLLAVPSHSTSAMRRVSAALITSVVHLEDSTSDRLAGYGPVDPSVERIVDPAIRDLHDRLSSLASRVNPAGRE
jgi:hypothetical protein